MKLLTLGILLLTSLQSSAYTTWTDFTPSIIFTEVPMTSLVTRNIVIRTKGMVNSCSGLFEGHKFKIKVLDCTDNGDIYLDLQFKNKVNCDQGMDFTKKLKVKLTKECLDNFYDRSSRIIINNKIFSNH